MKLQKRPFGLIVIIVVQVLAGLLSLAGGMNPSMFALGAQPQGLGFLQFLAPVLPLVLLALGVFYLSLSYGLWKGYSWAWTASIVFIVVHIIADIGFVASRSFAIDKFIGLIIIVSILGYLQLPGVRAWFGRGKKSNVPTAALETH